MVSVIIPVYNEEKTISDCLDSLSQQSYQSIEIIVVDDGSKDNSKIKIQNAKIQLKIKNLKILSQMHFGPGIARNLGAKHAKGEILVFVDADMIFDKDFVRKLVAPIIEKKSKGTFTKEEYVSNWDNIWARCWNYNQGIGSNRRIPQDYPNKSPVFRAILKSEFNKVEGFDNIGFTDDWTLSRKLGFKADLAPGAICYHRNPEDLQEVYSQARWIGKNEFISGTIFRRLFNLLSYNFIPQWIRGVWLSIEHKQPLFLVFQSIYCLAVQLSIIGSFLPQSKNK